MRILAHKCQQESGQAGEPGPKGMLKLADTYVWATGSNYVTVLESAAVPTPQSIMIQGLESASFMTGLPGPLVKMATNRGAGR